VIIAGVMSGPEMVRGIDPWARPGTRQPAVELLPIKSFSYGTHRHAGPTTAIRQSFTPFGPLADAAALAV
jgi:hypothetical protein